MSRRPSPVAVEPSHGGAHDCPGEGQCWSRGLQTGVRCEAAQAGQAEAYGLPPDRRPRPWCA